MFPGGAQVEVGGGEVGGGGRGEGRGGENLSSLHISKVVFYISLKEY